MAEIEAVLFDKDGTLFDFNATWGNWAKRFLLEICSQDARRARGLAAVAGFDFDNARHHSDSPIVSATPHQISAILIPHLPEYTSAQIIDQMNSHARAAVPVEATPLQPLLFDLRERALKLGVVTNDSLERTQSDLSASRVDGLFDRMLGCDSGFLPKPEPDMLLAFCEYVGVNPERVVMVGDSCSDLVAARSAGMSALGVLTGPSERRSLEPLADEILPSIGHLPAWLDRQQARAA